MKDINGKEIKRGDFIQGYKDRKFTRTKTTLYPTKIMQWDENLDYTFERHPKTKGPWIWKIDMVFEPMEVGGEEE